MTDISPTQEWELSYSHGVAKALVFTEEGQGLRKPFVIVGDAQAEDGTDLAALQAGLDHASYSFLSDLRARGYDAVLVGLAQGRAAALSVHGEVVTRGLMRVRQELQEPTYLVVGGLGRGAAAARFSLAKSECEMMDHQVGCFFSYNGTAPSESTTDVGEQNDAFELQGVGSWPKIPKKFGLVSRDFAGEPVEADAYDETRTGAATAGPAITKELGTWLLDAVQQ
ncbi:hypothetical protein AB0465_02645 [Streptomyces griseoviridis]|uniref:hypothetical protein n=1 Tax=Streptomyces griseoviridis TaxID=45398 RepID=UPI00344D0E57